MSIFKRKSKTYTYKVVESTTLHSFEVSVGNYLKGGWFTLGGVSTSVVKRSNRTNNEDTTLYTQALGKVDG